MNRIQSIGELLPIQGLNYLASPYSDDDPEIRAYRFRTAARAAAELHAHQHLAYSPIVYGHSIAQFGAPADGMSWERHNQETLRRCSRTIVLELPGIERSTGVAREVLQSRALNIPVLFWRPDVIEDGPLPKLPKEDLERAQVELDQRIHALGLRTKVEYSRPEAQAILAVSKATFFRLTNAYDPEPAGDPPYGLRSYLLARKRYVAYTALVQWLARNETYQRLYGSGSNGQDDRAARR